MKPPRRLTLDDSNDAPFAWLPDSRTVLFRSDRRGTLALFKQRIDIDSAEVLVSGKENVYIPRLSGDQQWILYSAQSLQPPAVSPSVKVPRRLMRLPVFRRAAKGGVSIAGCF
jgi:Tol biopolymer transport system component